MHCVKVISNLTASALLSEVFGWTLEVKIVRVPDEGAPNQWLWKVVLPLENEEVQRLFEPLILSSLQVTNDNLTAVCLITAKPTNVGYETHFTFFNCTFRKRGMRRIRKVFTQAMERWEMARQAVVCAWEVGGLQIQTEAKTVQLSQGQAPGRVNDLRVQVRAPHASQSELISFMMEGGESGLVFFDFDGMLARSGFLPAVQGALEIHLRDLVRKGMAECLSTFQEELTGKLPSHLLRSLHEIEVQRDRFEEAGISVQVNPHLGELMAHLGEYFQHKVESEQPGRQIHFRVYRSDELISEVMLEEKVIKIGWEQGSNCLTIEDESVSRIHAVIEQDCGNILLIDLGCELGTRVNGEPMPGKCTLHSGDEIAIGDFRIKVGFLEDVQTEVGAARQPNEAAAQGEVCEGIVNDCNGQVSEGFNLIPTA